MFHLDHGYGNSQFKGVFFFFVSFPYMLANKNIDNSYLIQKQSIYNPYSYDMGYIWVIYDLHMDYLRICCEYGGNMSANKNTPQRSNFVIALLRGVINLFQLLISFSFSILLHLKKRLCYRSTQYTIQSDQLLLFFRCW